MTYRVFLIYSPLIHSLKTVFRKNVETCSCLDVLSFKLIFYAINVVLCFICFIPVVPCTNWEGVGTSKHNCLCVCFIRLTTCFGRSGPFYFLTPWCRVLLEQLTDLRLVKKFPAFHGTRRFITAHTNVRHLSLSWASPIQSIYPHPTSWRSILILSTHLRLGLPSGLLPSGFPTELKMKEINRFRIFGRILYVMGNELLPSPGKTKLTHRHNLSKFPPPPSPREIVKSFAVHDAASLI